MFVGPVQVVDINGPNLTLSNGQVIHANRAKPAEKQRGVSQPKPASKSPSSQSQGGANRIQAHAQNRPAFNISAKIPSTPAAL